MGINIDSSVITDKAELENSQLLPCLKHALDPRIPDLSPRDSGREAGASALAGCWAPGGPCPASCV